MTKPKKKAIARVLFTLTVIVIVGLKLGMIWLKPEMPEPSGIMVTKVGLSVFLVFLTYKLVMFTIEAVKILKSE